MPSEVRITARISTRRERLLPEQREPISTHSQAASSTQTRTGHPRRGNTAPGAAAATAWENADAMAFARRARLESRRHGTIR